MQPHQNKTRHPGFSLRESRDDEAGGDVMATIVIGDPQRTNVMLTLGALVEVHGYETKGSFQFSRVQGEFTTILWEPQKFLAQVEVLERKLSGKAQLVSVDGDFDLLLEAESLGRVKVHARLNCDGADFEASFQFGIDQSYLPPIVRALKQSFPVQQ